MSRLEEAIDRYLHEQEEEMEVEETTDLFSTMIDFILSLDDSALDDDQQEELSAIVDMIDELDDDNEMEDEDEDEVNEVKKVRIPAAKKRANKMFYKKNKTKLKLLAKKYRKTSAGRKTALKHKRLKKQGRVKNYV